MKVKAKQLTYEDFGNRIIHTDKKGGTQTSRVISGVHTYLAGGYVNDYVTEGSKPYLKANFMITKISFLDGSTMMVAGDSEVEVDEDTTPMEFQVSRPMQTGMR